MPKLNLICTANQGLIPADEEAETFLGKSFGKTFTVDVRVQRSPQHNRMFWAVANKTHANLPERFASQWPTTHDMVKGLQLAFGFCDQIMKPIEGGWEVVQIPQSLDFANMEQDRFNQVSEALFKGMAHCLGVTVEDLLSESRAA